MREYGGDWLCLANEPGKGKKEEEKEAHAEPRDAGQGGKETETKLKSKNKPHAFGVCTLFCLLGMHAAARHLCCSVGGRVCGFVPPERPPSRRTKYEVYEVRSAKYSVRYVRETRQTEKRGAHLKIKIKTGSGRAQKEQATRQPMGGQALVRGAARPCRKDRKDRERQERSGQSGVAIYAPTTQEFVWRPGLVFDRPKEAAVAAVCVSSRLQSIFLKVRDCLLGRAPLSFLGCLASRASGRFSPYCVLSIVPFLSSFVIVLLYGVTRPASLGS